ncbi:C-type lectin domain family 3 member A [Bienertia sinuspersici]
MGSEMMEQHINDSSSDEEDGDEQWKAAINAAASAYLGCPQPNQTPTTAIVEHDDDAKPLQPQPIKHYQIKAQKALDDILTKSLVMVENSDSINAIDDHPVSNEPGVRLFKQAPVGIVFDHKDQYTGPKKKPRILPGEEINEKSKKFKRRLQSVVVEGTDVLATAKYACQKSLSKLEAKEAAARDAAKREEERVAQLKKIRGERWLPSIAREMQVKSQIR